MRPAAAVVRSVSAKLWGPGCQYTAGMHRYSALRLPQFSPHCCSKPPLCAGAHGLRVEPTWLPLDPSCVHNTSAATSHTAVTAHAEVQHNVVHTLRAMAGLLRYNLAPNTCAGACHHLTRQDSPP
jgi:hypothetical protein